MSVTLLHRTVSGVDSDGNDVFAATSTTLTGCVVWPRGSTEATHGQDLVVTGLTLLVPSGVTVAATDQFTVDGILYDVDGDAGAWLSPFTGWAPGTQVALVKATG